VAAASAGDVRRHDTAPVRQNAFHRH
jgi:hypothetical protein